jgi:hypothetical protein
MQRTAWAVLFFEGRDRADDFCAHWKKICVFNKSMILSTLILDSLYVAGLDLALDDDVTEADGAYPSVISNGKEV